MSDQTRSQGGEGRGRGGQSAPIIDLAAEPQPPRTPQPPDPPRIDRPPPRRGAGGIAGGILGAVIAIAAIYLLAAAGLLPSSAGRSADAGANAALEKRVAALEGGNVGTAVDALAAKVVALQTQVAALAAMPPPDPSAAVAPVAARVSRLEAALPDAGAGLAARLDVLEASVKEMGVKVAELAARPWGANESDRAARTVAIGTLRQAAEKGGAFAGDLAMLAALGSAPADVAALKPLAEKGAPSRAELQASFGDVADAILKATQPVDSGSGFLDRLTGFARGLVSVKPTAPVEGSTPQAIVSRMVADVARGDLAGALAERDALPDAGKAASGAWADAAATRIAIDRLIAKLSGSVAAPAGGG